MTRVEGSLIVISIFCLFAIAAGLINVNRSLVAADDYLARITILQEKIAINTTQPIRNETTITKVDQGVCSTLTDALKDAPKTDTKKGKK